MLETSPNPLPWRIAVPKYHISPDGNPRLCDANSGGCPYGEDVHGEFDSPEGARAFAERYLERSIGLFEENARAVGRRAREASRGDLAHGDEFRELSESEIRESLLNPGKPVAFNADGSLADRPSGTLKDPIDLAAMTPAQAEVFLKTNGFSDEQIANLKSQFGELSDRALITAATAELMTGPPQRHVRFSNDPDDNYSFSMTNFEEVGLSIGMLQADPETGFITPVRDPKASLSWMQVSSPANNVFMIQDHTGTNRLYMPQTANKNVQGEALRKLELLADEMAKADKNATIPDIARSSAKVRELQRDLRLPVEDLEALKNGDFKDRNGNSISRSEYLSKVEVNGRDWMVRDLKQNLGVTSSEESYGAAELAAMKPTQSGISVLQVQGMANATTKKFGQRVLSEKASLDAMRPQERAVRLQQLLDDSMGKATIVTEDNYILDGHHGLAKAALMNAALANGTVARRLKAMGVDYPLPAEAHLPIVKLNMDGGQGFDAVTYWTEKNGFPVSGMK